MFSSNQKLEVSGYLNPSVIKDALEYALKLYGKEYIKDKSNSPVGYQITEDNKFCLGVLMDDEDETDWKEFPIDFDSEVGAMFIYKFLDKQEYNLDGACDGAYEKGFLMKAISPNFSSSNTIKSSYCGIVSFEAFTNFYAK